MITSNFLFRAVHKRSISFFKGMEVIPSWPDGKDAPPNIPSLWELKS